MAFGLGCRAGLSREVVKRSVLHGDACLYVMSCAALPVEGLLVRSNNSSKSACVDILGKTVQIVTSGAASGSVAEISMLGLNHGSGMLRLSSCMLSIGHGA